MWRAACIDFDGTLAAFEGDFDELLDGVRTELGLLACDFATFRERLSTELRRPAPVTLGSALEAVLAGLELSVPEDLESVVAGAVASYGGAVRLRPGAEELLRALTDREVPLALVSNGPADMQRAAVEATGLRRFFRCLLVSGDDEVGARKPEERIFRLACAALDAGPAETLMIGDDLTADIRGALSAGLGALLVGGEAGEGYLSAPDLTSLQRRLDDLFVPPGS
jgi:HAD superfamily hydrolase (TIGR01549 family)